MSKHSRMSPSSLSRGKECILTYVLPQEAQKESEDARNGTIRHAILAAAIKAEQDANIIGTGHEVVSLLSDVFELLGMNPYIEKENLGECLAAMEPFIDYADVDIEVSVSLEEELGTTDFDGTCDYIIETTDTLRVVDYKSGKSKVKVMDNWQLLTYLAAAYVERPKKKEYYYAVLQPTHAPIYREVKVKEKHIIKHIKRLKALHKKRKKAQKLYDKKGIGAIADLANMGHHCWFCTSKPFCPAQQAHKEEKNSIQPLLDALKADSI